MRRLVGKALMNSGPLLGQLKALALLQCGVGIPGACESIGQGLQAVVLALPNDPSADWVVMQIDVSNAFNTVDRNAVLQGAVSFSPTMYPWLRFLYERPAHLVCQGQSLLSRTGVHQGFPLGPAALAVGLHSAALSIRTHGLTWGFSNWMMESWWDRLGGYGRRSVPFASP